MPLVGCWKRSIRSKIESVAGHTTLAKVAALRKGALWMTGSGLSGKCVGFPSGIARDGACDSPDDRSVRGSRQNHRGHPASQNDHPARGEGGRERFSIQETLI